MKPHWYQLHRGQHIKPLNISKNSVCVRFDIFKGFMCSTECKRF